MLPSKHTLNKLSLLVVIQAAVCCSCGREKKALPFYDTETDTEAITDTNDIDNTDVVFGILDGRTEVSVPFVEKSGIKYVKTSINGQPFDMIFDTGCSGTLISVAEAQYLYQKGCLTTDDFYGTERARIADGSIVENMVVNLKEVIIDDKILFRDVKATVSSNTEAPLLLGNEVLNRVPMYEIDNDNKCINFKL